MTEVCENWHFLCVYVHQQNIIPASETKKLVLNSKPWKKQSGGLELLFNNFPSCIFIFIDELSLTSWHNLEYNHPFVFIKVLSSIVIRPIQQHFIYSLLKWMLQLHFSSFPCVFLMSWTCLADITLSKLIPLCLLNYCHQ